MRRSERLAEGAACLGIRCANACGWTRSSRSFKVPERPSRLDAFADRLSAWLRTEAKKSRKQKRTIKQLHADLLSLGYEGSYGRVAAFAREWKADLQRELQTTGRETFVPLSFDPGEAFQFDWSEDWAIIGHERTKLQVAHKVGRGKERDVNVRCTAMVSHYLFEPEFCNPASGWEKGQVEKNVQDPRHRLWQPRYVADVFPTQLLMGRTA
jgi:hypothetical protein